MPSSTDISSQITQALNVTQPDLDTSIGTPVRKMIDAVSVSISSAYVDQYFLNYQYDVTSLTGSALDDFVNIFGITRFLATRATGVVTFTRPTPATQPIAVLSGTAVSNNSSPQVVFTTITTSTMPIGSVSVDVPVIAQVGGASGNVVANSITNFQTQISGIASLTNISATSGGNDAESDEALINRFQNTVFRNMAGTEPQFLGTAQENANTTNANVIGAYKTQSEQIQIVNGVGQSTVQSAQYIYNQNFVFGTDIDSGQILNPGVNYTFNSNTYALVAPITTTPTNLAITTVAATPTYSSAVHNYKVAWGNENGITPPSVDLTVTSGGTTASKITWVPPENAVWAYIYQGGAGTETLRAIIPASTLSWTDLGVGSVQITGITNNTPAVVTTATAHGFVNGQIVSISGVLGATQANGTWVITYISSTQFSITANVIGVYADDNNDNPTGTAAPASYGIAFASTNTTGYAPTITSIDQVNCPDGIYELQFDYTPIASRNSPSTGVTNKVDIYVAGQDIQSATDTLVFSNANVFSNSPSSSLFYMNYQRPDGSHPLVGNYLLDLTFAPVTQLPDEIALSASAGTSVSSSIYQTIGGVIITSDSGASNDIGAQTYNLGEDYYLVNDISNMGGTAHSNSGIEFSASTTPQPPSNSLITLTYNYNALPGEVETAIENWRLITTDVWCHQAINMYIAVNLVVILSGNTSITSITPSINTAIQSVFNSVGFDGTISTSSILRAAGSIPGVQAVRFATSADSASNYAMQQLTVDGALVQTFAFSGSGSTARAIDVEMNDDTIPVLNSVNLTVRAMNTFQNGA